MHTTHTRNTPHRCVFEPRAQCARPLSSFNRVLLRPSVSRLVCRAAGDQQQPNQSAELCRGEAENRREIRKAVGAQQDGEGGKLSDEDDDEGEEEEEQHGLEDLGDAFLGPLTNTQEKYKEKLKAKLEQEKEAERIATEARSGTFNNGKRAYERGQYKESVEWFEKALNEEGWMSRLGGEIQMWLALGYQAVGRDADCIDVYKTIEETHPLRKVRNQAANLRFILQAPKLKRGPDEMIQLPILDVEERKKTRRGNFQRPLPTAVIEKKRKKSWEEEFWENYTPPKWTKNRYVWWASGVLAVGLTIWGVTLPR